MNHNPVPRDDEPAGFWHSRYAIGLVVMAAVAGYFLLSEHRAHFFGALPFLVLLACPLMHVFMHGSHGRHGGGHGDHRGGQPGASIHPEPRPENHHDTRHDAMHRCGAQRRRQTVAIEAPAARLARPGASAAPYAAETA